MQIIGYVNEWTVRPGATIDLHVSSREGSYNLAVLRLRHGDDNPAGPGFKAETVATDLPARLNGEWHDVPSGSYALVEDAGELLNTDIFSLAAWVFATAPDAKPQVIAARGEKGFVVEIDSEGRPSLKIGTMVLRGAYPLAVRQWYLLVVRVDRNSGKVQLQIEPRNPWPEVVRSDSVEGSCTNTVSFDGPLAFAARMTATGVEDHFNGKIDTPQIFDRWLSDGDVDLLRKGLLPADPMACWDFAKDHQALHVPANREEWTAQLVGMPMRAVAGYRSNGTALRPQERPDHYSAIHFHDDDKHDAGWPVATSLTIPDGWASGIYAFHLTTDAGHEYYVPFFLLPEKNRAHSSIAFLVPTFSYICYGNMHSSHVEVGEEVLATLPKIIPESYIYIREQRLNSTYDLHSDGSGVAYISRRLPQPHVSPKYIWGNGSPHQLNADLHLVDWLHEKGFAHDVLTDEALHFEGIDLLSPYRVIVTGTHPEYWSGQMLDAVQAYLRQGGRVMYMGGNGFYWVTTVHPNAPHVLEVRKFGGTRTWSAEPNERHHSTTGEQGGLWRDRGRSTYEMLGVGFSGMGYDVNAPYRRMGSSYEGPFAILFDGIVNDVIGDTPSLVLKKNAAGLEIDRINYLLGSPPNTVCLARSFDHGKHYQVPYEDAMAYMTPAQLEHDSPLLCSDIAFLRYPNGGAVFSAGSISYCGSLSFNNYENDISRLTENVLNLLNGSQPLPGGAD